MAERKKVNNNKLMERMVRNDDIFCSILLNKQNKTLRVVDFRGGNFQTKHAYLERVLIADGMRKIFTLIERDDMNGWQRVGYHREGTIPGYYKRSDAYIMARIYDEDWNGAQDSDELPERKNFFNDVKNLGKEISELKSTGLKAEHIAEEELTEMLKTELSRTVEKPKKTKSTKSTAKKETKKQVAPTFDEPLFMQFSREADSHFFVCQNRRTKQLNVLGAEYQDCFGNAKVDIYFPLKNKTDMAIARHGLMEFVNWLAGIGAVAIFSLVRADDIESNALYYSAGFRNSGWMHRQLLTPEGNIDQVLWTKKLT